MGLLSRWNAVASTLAALVAVVVMACPPAQAQVKPFKVKGQGVGPTGIPLPGQPPRPHWIVGEATHLGRHYGEGAVQTDSAGPGPGGSFMGEFGSAVPFKFMGANGDILACHYGRTAFGASTPGTFTLVPAPGQPGLFVAYWIAEFVAQPTLGTGKFAGATGSWVMYAVSEPFDPFGPGAHDPVGYSWEGEGWLTFKKGK